MEASRGSCALVVFQTATLALVSAGACTSVEIEPSDDVGGGAHVEPPADGGSSSNGASSAGGAGEGGFPPAANPDPSCIPNPELPAGEPVVLATGLAYPLHLALAGDDVFVTEFNENEATGRIARVPKSGGEVERVVTGLARPWHITSSGSDVYWSNSSFEGSVQRYSAADGSTSVVESSLEWPFDVAIHGGLLYVTDATGVKVLPSQSSGTLETFTTNLPQHVMAVDETGVYVSTNDFSGKVPSVISHIDAAGNVTDFYDGNEVNAANALKLDGNHLYFSTSWGGIWRGTRDDGPLVELANVDDFVGDAVVADCFVYFTVHDQGQIVRVPLQGGDVQVVATDQVGAYGIVVDDEAIWWVTDTSGTLVRLDK